MRLQTDLLTEDEETSGKTGMEEYWRFAENRGTIGFTGWFR